MFIPFSSRSCMISLYPLSHLIRSLTAFLLSWFPPKCLLLLSHTRLLGILCPRAFSLASISLWTPVYLSFFPVSPQLTPSPLSNLYSNFTFQWGLPWPQYWRLQSIPYPTSPHFPKTSLSSSTFFSQSTYHLKFHIIHLLFIIFFLFSLSTKKLHEGNNFYSLMYPKCLVQYLINIC